MSTTAANSKKPSIPPRDHVFFAPPTWPLPGGPLARHRTYRYGHRMGYSEFQSYGDDLLLSQSPTGALLWAYMDNLMKKEEHMVLHPCAMGIEEATKVARNRTLCIPVSDPRLCNFDLLGLSTLSSRNERCENMSQFPILKCPNEDGIQEPQVTDLVAMHLALGYAVEIFDRDANGRKYLDEVRTVDYRRAKKNAMVDPSTAQNLRRFCNRVGPVREGPSCLEKQVCYSKHDEQCGMKGSTIINPLKNEELEFITNSVSTRESAEDDGSCGASEYWGYQEEMKTKYSTKYHLMKLVGVGWTKGGQSRLAAEKYKCDLKLARTDKRREESNEMANKKGFCLKNAAVKVFGHTSRPGKKISVSMLENMVAEKRPSTPSPRKDLIPNSMGAEPKETASTVSTISSTLALDNTRKSRPIGVSKTTPPTNTLRRTQKAISQRTRSRSGLRPINIALLCRSRTGSRNASTPAISHHDRLPSSTAADAKGTRPNLLTSLSLSPHLLPPPLLRHKSNTTPKARAPMLTGPMTPTRPPRLARGQRTSRCLRLRVPSCTALFLIEPLHLRLVPAPSRARPRRAPFHRYRMRWWGEGVAARREVCGICRVEGGAQDEGEGKDGNEG